VGFAQAERAIKCERIAGAAAVALWGDYSDIGKEESVSARQAKPGAK